MEKIRMVAVVDDDEVYTFAVKRIIARSEIAQETTYFQNGKAALDFFTNNLENQAQLPDLILLDINMPVMDGWQFMDAFIALQPHLTKKITVYIVSSSIDEDDYNKAKSIEAVTDFIVKPVTVDALQQILQHWQD
jgi:CheY-like chemotaxis protein